MKTQINIIKHENKTSKEGKDYTRFNTSAGWCSAFDTEIIEDLKKAEGRRVSVDIATSADGKFKNIRKFHGIVAPGLETMDEAIQKSDAIIETATSIMKPKDFGKKEYILSSMYVSYAKDIFCSLVDVKFNSPQDRMSLSIDLIKQAHDAFN